MSRRRPPTAAAAILGAAGAVGGLFAREMHASGWSITGLDLRAPREGAAFTRFVVGDALSPEASATLAASDCVLLCLPHQEAMRALGVLPRASMGLLVDTLSVKTPVVEGVARARLACEHLSINPMFAPSLGFEGQAVAVVDASGGARAATFVRMLERWGAHVVKMSADEHDRMCAAMQAGTHAALLALGQVSARSFGVQRLAEVAPPPHLVCLSLVARMASAAPETYWDIQRHNPHAASARRALLAALTELDEAVSRDDEASFARALRGLAGSFGPDLERFSAAAAAAIQAVAPITSAQRRGRPRSRTRRPR